MAFIVGIASDEEIEELKRRNWEVENAEDYPGLVGDMMNNLIATPTHGDKVIAVFVDNSVFDIMNGPDWDKGEDMAEAPNKWLNFGEAIQAMKEGKKVARQGWNGKGMWVALQRPTDKSKMTLPYIYMSTVTGDLVPWLASQTDMLSEDWSIVE